MRGASWVNAWVLGCLATVWSAPVFAQPGKPVFECKAPATAPAAEGRWPLLAKVAPRFTQHCVDGEVIGVIAAYTGKLREPSVDQVYAIEPQTDTRYVLTLPGDAPRVVRFLDSREPAALGTKDGAGQPYVVKSAQLSYRKRREQKLTADAHLVRMRVNDGRGSAPRQWELTTDRVEVLDGTPAYPLSVSKRVPRR